MLNTASQLAFRGGDAFLLVVVHRAEETDAGDAEEHGIQRGAEIVSVEADHLVPVFFGGLHLGEVEAEAQGCGASGDLGGGLFGEEREGFEFVGCPCARLVADGAERADRGAAGVADEDARVGDDSEGLDGGIVADFGVQPRILDDEQGVFVDDVFAEAVGKRGLAFLGEMIGEAAGGLEELAAFVDERERRDRDLQRPHDDGGEPVAMASGEVSRRPRAATAS